MSASKALTTETAATLSDIVGDVDSFFKEKWGRQPIIWRAPSNIEALLTEDEIWEEVDKGFLHRPYFTMFNEGIRSAMTDITRPKKVVGKDLPGFINPEQIRADFRAGGTFKLNQAEHWHPRIRTLVKAMETHFDGGLEAFVFLSPPDKTAIQAHTDGAHVLVLQLAGKKDWVVGKLHENSTSASTLHEGEIDPTYRVEATLTAGDVLYMPHGAPHYATARDGNSIHLAITIEEPSAIDLAQVVLAEFLAEESSLDDQEGLRLESLASRIEGLRRRLGESLGSSASSHVAAAASTLRKLHRI
ncbi:JmjC domain-containing protein [Rathayibacter tritici]|uniref:JmjC domain-containing protein n=1 Tax=Rathayibacter tritici TaxID=33888 RepID=A0A160KTQ7_9MICO|nr:cupin domain-containing protein [Rathayibacter tritici]AND17196.1 hypothetical protein A6122_2072 [Rathayibacter tritici]